MIEGPARQLRTPRLLLRRWEENDLVPFAEINADPRVTRYLGDGGRPLTRLETEAYVQHITEHWKRWGYGLWAVELVEARRFAGYIGASHHRWYPDEAEVGWRLDSTLWSRGIATEGAAAALEHLFTTVALDRVISVVHRDNTASRRVAEKNGFWIEREENRDSLPVLVYRLDRTSWESRRR